MLGFCAANGARDVIGFFIHAGIVTLEGLGKASCIGVGVSPNATLRLGSQYYFSSSVSELSINVSLTI